jgi:glycine dehydrogenase
MKELLSAQQQEFSSRHIGITQKDLPAMLETIGVDSLDALVDKTVPTQIRNNDDLVVTASVSEAAYLKHAQEIASMNEVRKTYIGAGYYNTFTPSVILRNIFENPGWYTQYTPYQAEIAQGRLESLLNYQTMVCDLTGLPISNASLLDEATAAAEAMNMFCFFINKDANNLAKPKFFVDNEVFPQVKNVLITRATPINIEIVFGDYKTAELDHTFFGAYVQYPNNIGSIVDYRNFIDHAHSKNIYVAMGTDLLALCLLTSPGELGADVACGSAQRFGVPLGYGGPHAAFFACSDEFKRHIPGRIIGVSIDANGKRALRMALQTREQHIKREKATSNICTAQALLSNMAAMYAVYHGPHGLKNIALRVHTFAKSLASALAANKINLASNNFFDTIVITGADTNSIKQKAISAGVNFRYFDNGNIGISCNRCAA